MKTTTGNKSESWKMLSILDMETGIVSEIYLGDFDAIRTMFYNLSIDQISRLYDGLISSVGDKEYSLIR